MKANYEYPLELDWTTDEKNCGYYISTDGGRSI